MIRDSCIFKNEDALLPEYLPEILPHREDKIEMIADNLMPAANGRKPQNTFLFGSPGTGKTAVMRFVFRELEDYSGVKTFYINCWDYKSIHSILTKMAIDMGAFAQRRGVGKDEALEKMIEYCKKLNKGLVVCLDEADQLMQSDDEALYDLLRINQYIKNPFGIVFISNNPYIFSDIDPRMKSSLNVEEIEFNSYSMEQLKDILKRRAEITFFRVEEGVILLAANHALQNGGDVRIGLECLLKAGREAEKRGASKLMVEHVKSVLPTVKAAKPQILMDKVNEDEKMIAKIVEERRTMLSGELYKEYSKRSEDPVSERSFRDFVNHLAEVNLVKVRNRKRGIRGRTRVISKV
jgi:cell division control protein 6